MSCVQYCQWQNMKLSYPVTDSMYIYFCKGHRQWFGSPHFLNTRISSLSYFLRTSFRQPATEPARVHRSNTPIHTEDHLVTPTQICSLPYSGLRRGYGSLTSSVGEENAICTSQQRTMTVFSDSVWQLLIGDPKGRTVADSGKLLDKPCSIRG